MTTPREQAVEAAHLRFHGIIPPSRCNVLGCVLNQRAETAASVLWPLAERAALDRAEKALREHARLLNLTANQSAFASQKEFIKVAQVAYSEAADLVASLRPEEPGA